MFVVGREEPIVVEEKEDFLDALQRAGVPILTSKPRPINVSPRGSHASSVSFTQMPHRMHFPGSKITPPGCTCCSKVRRFEW